MAKCKHDHECEQCVREQIASLTKKIVELQKKLPSPTLIIDRHYVPMPYPIHIVQPIMINPQTWAPQPNQVWCGGIAGGLSGRTSSPQVILSSGTSNGALG